MFFLNNFFLHLNIDNELYDVHLNSPEYERSLL